VSNPLPFFDWLACFFCVQGKTGAESCCGVACATDSTAYSGNAWVPASDGECGNDSSEVNNMPS